MNDTVETQEGPRAGAAVLGGLFPYIQVDGAAKAAEFYTRAFGAKEAERLPLDEQGRTMHLHLYVNGSSLMLCDFYPEHGFPAVTPQGYTLQLILKDADIDAWWKRAVEAGAEVVMPLDVMFWGDRYGQLRDPFGVIWAMDAPAETR
ncbi:VOC family protein [Rhizobium sp. BK251]|uniref:VOC family protein n=1 Tax=Rhizobium sp. BK251 TaxID=2512125 RepID=UPI00104A86DB|nr:VOC family protein [Rhizobium sp. BK251]TCL75528.1 putative glyoxalase superfamily protein PhnB [Rhizobium sp. BK251]